MRIWATIITIVIIYPSHVFTAPLKKSGSAVLGGLKKNFGKIADEFVMPQWAVYNPDSKNKNTKADNKDPNNTPNTNTKADNKDPNNTPNTNTKADNKDPNNTPNTNDVDDPKKTNNDIDDSNNDKQRRPKKISSNKIRRKKSNNNKKRNNRKQNNTGLDGSYKWYKIVTVEYIEGYLPEYKNHEDEQKTVLKWGNGDEQKIVLNEHVDALSMKNLNNNQLIRKKRDYNNTFQLQDKLQTENVKQHDSKENKLDTESNTNDNAKGIETQTMKLGNKRNVKKKKNFENHEKSREHDSFEEELSLIDNLEENENSMDSDINENTNENSSINKLKQIVKNKKHPTNTFRNNQTYRHKLRRSSHEQHLDKTPVKNNSETEKLDQETSKKILENLNDTPTISKNLPEFTIEGNIDNAINIPEELAKIDTFIDEMNSNSVGNEDNQKYESYQSSFEKKQEIPNFSDIEDNKEHDILNNIRHQVKSKSKNKGEKQSDNNEKQKNKYKQKLSKATIINENGTHLKKIKPNSSNSKNVLISYDEPEIIKKKNDEIAIKITADDPIDTSIDEIKSNSEENLDYQNNRSFPSSLYTKREIPSCSDIEDTKERDILNDVKFPFKPISNKFGKKQSDNNNKFLKRNKQKLSTPMKTNNYMEKNNNNEKGSQQKFIKPVAPYLNEIPRKSNDVTKLTTRKTTEIARKIPGVNEIDTIIDEMYSNSDEGTVDLINESNSSFIEKKQEIKNYSDIEDHKKRDILKSLEHPKTPKSKNYRKKQSNDNDKLLKIYKQQLSTPTNKYMGKKSHQRSIKPIAPNSNEVPKNSNNVPKLTTELTSKIPEVYEIDKLFDEISSDSDENTDDLYNESHSSSTSEENINTSNIINSGVDTVTRSNGDLFDEKPHKANIENINIIPKISDDDISRNLKKHKNVSTNPNDDEKKKLKERNKYQKKTIANTILQTSNMNDDIIPSIYETQNKSNKDQSINMLHNDNIIIETSQDSNNIESMILEENNGVKSKDKPSNVPKVQNKSLTQKKKTNYLPINKNKLNSEHTDNTEISNSIDETTESQIYEYINDHLYDNTSEEKLNDKVPTIEAFQKKLPTNASIKEKHVHKKIKPKTLIKKNGKKISDKNMVNGKNIKTDIPSIPEAHKETSNRVLSNQEIIDLFDKSDSNSIDELLDSHINGSGSGMPSMNDIDLIQIENNEESLIKTKDDQTKRLITNDSPKTNVFDKNKSLERSNTNIQTPHLTVETISNKRDESNEHIKTPSNGNSAKEVDVYDISNGYSNLGGMTMKDFDVKRPEDKSTDIPKKQVNAVMKKNKSIPNIINGKTKPEISDLLDALNFSDELPEEEMAYVDEHHSNAKEKNEKSNDKSNSKIPTMDTNTNPKARVSIGVPFDENYIKDNDDILKKKTKPKTVKHNSDDDDVDKQRNTDVQIPRIQVNIDDETYSLPSKQKTVDLFDKSDSNSIDELLDSNVTDSGSGMPSMNDIDAIQIENNEESLRKIKDDKTKPLIPNEGPKTNVFAKNKSLEKSNKNSQTPHLTVETISNKRDESNEHIKTPSNGNSAKGVDVYDISNGYSNLGGMTMKDFDVKRPEDKSTDIPKKQVNDVMKKNKSIPNIINDRTKPEISDSLDALNFSDELPEEEKAYIDEHHSNAKEKDEKSNDKSNSKIPTIHTNTNPKARVSIGVPFDENYITDNDDILKKKKKPKTVDHKSDDDDDVDKQRNTDVKIPRIQVNVNDETYSLPGKQKIVELFDKPDSNSIDDLLDSHINGSGSGMPSMNDIDAIQIENNEESLRKIKDDKTKPLIPNDGPKTKIFDKNKSLENSNNNSETPHLTEQTITNKRDEPNEHIKTPSIGNSAKEVDVYDISNGYSNLGGMTMEDYDVKRPEEKSTDIPKKQVNDVMKKNKSIPNIINDRTKPEISDLLDALNFSDELPEEEMAYVDEHHSNAKEKDEKSNDKSNSKIPTMDTNTNPKASVSIGVPIDENYIKNNDDILKKKSKPKTVDHISDDVDKQRNTDVQIPRIQVNVDDETYSLPSKQKIDDLLDKSDSNSIDELLDSLVTDSGSGMPSMNDIDAIQIENNEESLRKIKDDKTKPLIPNDGPKTNVFDKNKSLERSNTIIQTPHLTVENISNKRDESNEHFNTPSNGNSAKEVDVYDISNGYSNLGGMTVEDFDVKRPEDKSTDIPKKQVNDVMKKNKSIPNIINDKTKPEICDLLDALKVSDEMPEEEMAYVDEHHSNAKEKDEKSNDKSNFKIPTMDTNTNPKARVSIGVPFDENYITDNDDILKKKKKPKTVDHKSDDDDDVDKQRNTDVKIPRIQVNVNDETYSLPGKQKIVELFDKPDSNSIDDLLDSHINGSGSGMPSMNDIDAIQIENNEESLRKIKDDKTKPLIPNDGPKTKIFDKNKSLENSNNNSETPHLTEQTITNKRDEPNEHIKTPSIGNSAKEVDVYDISNGYSNLGGMTMEDYDVKRPEEKSTDIPKKQVNDVMKKNKSIPNIINDRTKPEISDLLDALNFSDELPEEEMAYVDEHHSNAKEKDEKSNDKSNSKIPTMDTNTNPKASVSIGVPIDENYIKNNDDILKKKSKPKTVDHISDDVDKQRNTDVQIPRIQVNVDDETYSLPSKQKIDDLLDKSDSNSIDELLDSLVTDSGSGMPSMNDIDAIQIENNEESLRKIKDDKTKPLIPNDGPKTNVFDKNKSLERSNTIIQTPHLTVENISNKRDESNEHFNTPSNGNSAKEVDVYDISNGYSNLGGMTVEDFDVKRPEDKSTDIPKKQVNDVMKKNKSIPNIINDKTKPEISDLLDALKVSDEMPEEEMAYVDEHHSNAKEKDEKSNDKSNFKIPTMDTNTNPKARVSIGVPFDENYIKDNNDILKKKTKPKTVGHNSDDDDDVDKQRNTDVKIPRIQVNVNDETYSLPGKQKIVELFDKPDSNSIDDLLDSHINGSGSGMPSMNDIDAIQIENNEESLRKIKDDKTKPLIPNDGPKTKIFDKNKSLENSNNNSETPHLTEQTITNKRDEPNEHIKTPSIGNSAKEVDVYDISNGYSNLGGMTMEDYDVKRPEEKSTDIPKKQVNDVMKKNKSIPNIINDRTKPEISDLLDALNFSDELPEEEMAYVDEHHSNAKEKDEKSNDKSNSKIPTMDTNTNPKASVSIGVPIDENYIKNNDDILKKKSKPKTVDHISDDVDKQRNTDVQIPRIQVNVDDETYSLPSKQKIDDLLDKSDSNSIDELLDSLVTDSGSGMPSMNDIDAIQIENNEESLRKIKDDKTKPLIPNDGPKTNVFDKNKSLERSNTIIQTPHLTVENISNKRDESNEHFNTPSNGNSAKEVDVYDISNGYSNLGGMTVEDFDVKRPEDKSTDIPKKQVNDVMKKNKSIPNIINDKTKPEICDLLDALKVSDEMPEEEMAYVDEHHSNAKEKDEKSNDKSNFKIPTMDTNTNPKARVSIGVPFDENYIKDNDDILKKKTKPKTVDHKSDDDDDVDKQRNTDVHIPRTPVNVDDVPYSLLGKQKIVDLFDKTASNSIDELLDSHINGSGSGMPSMNDINLIQIENNEESLRKTKDDKTKPLITNDSPKTNVFDKNKSLERSNTNIQTPHLTVENISNKRDESNEHFNTPSNGNSAKEVDVYDISNGYSNLGGMTMEDYDVKRPEEKSTDIPKKQVNDVMKKNKSIPNIINDRTKPEICDLLDALNFSDELPEEEMAYVDEHHSNAKEKDEKSNDKSNSKIPTMDTNTNPTAGATSNIPFEENYIKDNDDILKKKTKPKTVDHKSDDDDDVDKQRNTDVHIPRTPVNVDDVPYSLLGKQKIVDLFDKTASNSIDELLDSHINGSGSGMPSMNDIDAIQIENNEESLRKIKDDKTKPLIPNEGPKTNVFAKNKSLEKSNKNSQTPHLTVETISNKRDESNEHIKTPSNGNSAKGVDVYDISNGYSNLGGMTMKDFDVKRPEDKSTDIPKKQVNNVMKKNKSIPNIINDRTKPEISDTLDALNFSDELPEEEMAYVDEHHSNAKEKDEKSNDKSNSKIPTMDTNTNPKARVSSNIPFDENYIKDNDDILKKKTKPKTVDHKSDDDDDVDKQRNTDVHIPRTPVNEDDVPYSLLSKQKIVDLFDKTASNSIDELLDSHINGSGSGMPSMNDINLIQIENNEESLRKTKDDKTKPLITNDSPKTNVFDKNKTLERSNPNIQTPHLTVENISNKLDESNEHFKTPSNGNSEDKSTDIPQKQLNDVIKKKKSIPNIINDRTKLVVTDTLKTLNLSDEVPDDQYIEDLTNGKANDEKSNEKSNSKIPTMDTNSNPKAGVLIDVPFDENNIKNNNGILHKKIQPTKVKHDSDDDIDKQRNADVPNLTLEAISNKHDESIDRSKTPSIGNSVKDFDVYDISIRHNNLGGMTIEDFDLKQPKVKLPDIPKKLENDELMKNKSIPNIVNDRNKPEIAEILNTSNCLDDLSGDQLEYIKGLKNDNAKDEKLYDISTAIMAPTIYTHPNPIFGLSPFDMKDSILHKIPQPNLLKSKTGKFHFNRDGDNAEISDSRTAANVEHTLNYETLKDIEKTNIDKDEYLLSYDSPKINVHEGSDNIYYDSNHIDKLTKLINHNHNMNHYTSSTMVSSEYNLPLISDYKLTNENDNPYGYMVPKFSTKYIEGGDSNNNLWERIPSKKNYDFIRNTGYTINNKISSYVNSDKKIATETDAFKNIYDDKENTDIHSHLVDDSLKKLSEQLFKKIDNIEDKISKFGKSSNNSPYIGESYNIKSNDPSTKQIIPINDLPNGKPKIKNTLEEPNSKTNNSVEIYETIINNKSNGENEIKESAKVKKDKHKIHSKHKKKKNYKKSYKNYDDYDDDDDNDDDDGNDNDDDDDDDARQIKCKCHNKKYSKDGGGKYKKNISHKKRKIIDNDNVNDGRHKKKNHKKSYDSVSEDFDVSQSKNTDKKNKKKVIKNIKPHESNDVNNSSSLQINSEDNDSVNGLNIKRKSKKTNSTKRKSASPKTKSKHKKQSKSIKHKNKEITVDVSDEDSISNENNYNLEETYEETSHNNIQNNIPKKKKMKHKERKNNMHKKPFKTTKTYKYKEIPVDYENKSSDENNVNIEETYNININKDDKVSKQKRLRHKRLKKMKNFDINIVKDTDNQVLNKDANTKQGFQFFTFYPQYRYTNPLGRLFY